MSKDVIDDLSQIKYDGEGIIGLLRHKASFLGLCERNEFYLDDTAYGLFTYMLEMHIKKWCLTLPTTSIHSFNHMIIKFNHAFFHYDHKELNHKNLGIMQST